MDSARWERMQEVFHRALELPADERQAFVAAACGADAALLASVLAMLDEDERQGSLLERDVAHVAHHVLERAPPALPDEFGPYRIVRALGEGGMGRVYLAERTDVGNRAALKILRDAWLSPVRRERFASEQRVLAQLNHPWIARLYDAGTLPDGTPWFVMEYVEGVPLTDYCRARTSTVPERLRLLRDVCEAVLHAHRHLVVHRDLKPSNVLVTADGQVKLLDFGIAKQLAGADAPVDQTRTGVRFMTPAYAAPEQLGGTAIGVHTDVYSLGAMLYELLTGAPLFDLSGRTPREAETVILEQEPERPSAVVRRSGGPAGVPLPGRAAWADLDVLCLTALQKEPHRRYRTVDALIRDIDHFLAGEPLDARPDTAGYRLGKFLRRNRARVATAAVTLCAAMALAAFHTVSLTEQRTLAETEAVKARQVAEYLIDLFEAGDPFAVTSGELDVRTLLARGVDRAEALVGQPDVQGQMFDVLGRVYTMLSEYEQAEVLLDRALALRRARPDRPLEIAQTLYNLGDLHRFRGNFERAEALMRESLTKRERYLPARHPDLATSLDGLGITLNNQGRYAEAETVYRRALEMRRALYPEPHVLLAHSLNNLAINQSHQANYADAERYLRESLAIGRSVLGADNASLASDLSNLGVVLDIRGDYAGAEEALVEALRIKRLRLGDVHYETATTLAQLGGMLRRAGAPDRAEAALREALDIEAQVLDPAHRNAGVTRFHLAGVLQDRADYQGAETLLRAALAIFRESLGDRHDFTATVLCRLGEVVFEQGAVREPDELYRECLGVLEEVLSDDNDVLNGYRSRHGAVLTRQSRFAEAEPLLVDSHGALERLLGPAHRETREAARRLVALYEAWEQPERAGPYRETVGR